MHACKVSHACIASRTDVPEGDKRELLIYRYFEIFAKTFHHGTQPMLTPPNLNEIYRSVLCG
jgi:hypothetical protein